MTRLLVSVRNAAEAGLALEAGVDVIDLKEPNRGALGRADLAEQAATCAAVAADRPLSVAAGELLEVFASEAKERGVSTDSWQILPQVAFAKFGLAGCRLRPDWPALLSAVQPRLPPHCALVLAIYADEPAQSPDWRELLALLDASGQGHRVSGVLVDTWDKRSGGLLSHWSVQEAARFVAAVQERGWLAALAGQLQAADLGRLLPAGPDLLGVRGAACSGGRTGPLDAQKTRRLVETLYATRPAAQSALARASSSAQ